MVERDGEQARFQLGASGHRRTRGSPLAIELEHRFGKDSRVRDYWLAASEGFAVQSADGRRLGTVRQVVHKQDGRAAALVVEARRGLVRTDDVVLEAEAVEEVAPWRSALVVPPGHVPVPEPANRWPEVRGAMAARGAAAVRFVVAGVRRDAAFARARWPSMRARVLHAWAWTVAALVGIAGAATALFARLVRVLAAARSAARS